MSKTHKPNTPPSETSTDSANPLDIHSEIAEARQSLVASPDDSRALDAHGHDPDEYFWIPISRPSARHDGWSPERQREFIEYLADSGSVTDAARMVHMTTQSAYRLRREPRGKQFAAAWDAAIGHAMRKLTDIAMDRAILGAEDRIIRKDGVHIYTKYKPSDRLLMFLLKAHHPQVYGDRHAVTPADERGGLDIAEALDRLIPIQPDDKAEYYTYGDKLPDPEADYDPEAYRNDPGDWRNYCDYE
ncbi:hypothetical protein [Alterisphingorhabdus coralli]|uniref:Uncharacterized protein n=1 Tax=Alterisphingorhabdus coralli TaxID=3071408 RepID=A0AA97F9E2_9SPHN|nr:hypothetical protein [Parasphingorhabdus sp. SCSIO 66989]WOE76393.1 hypothetical protein RB602_06680 [Parasphingorhabdus sp. SCSIO 66989]